MIIFTDKETNEVIGTVDGFGEDIGLFIGDPEKTEKTVIGLGHPLEQWAREFEDPRNSKQVFEYKFKEGNFEKIPDDVLEARKPKHDLNKLKNLLTKEIE